MFSREDWQTIEFGLATACDAMANDLDRMDWWPESQQYADADMQTRAAELEKVRQIHASVQGLLRITQEKNGQ